MRRQEQSLIDEDAKLVSFCKKGNVDAFEELVIKHQKKMLNIAFRMIGNYEDACEIVQDAFVSAYKAIRHFEEKARFTTWLYTIVVNLSRNRLNQLKIKNSREAFSMDDPVLTDSSELAVELASSEPSVLERLEKRDAQKKVQACIDSLDNEFKEVIILRDMQGFSYDEISDMLKMPAGTVKSRLFRAREMLRDRLKRVMGDL
jgi:RNA polymerase sigma-70 factor (ECF subfamily)